MQTSENLESQGTDQKKEPEMKGEGDLGMDTVIKFGKNSREILPKMQLKLTSNRGLQPEGWKDLEQALKSHKLLKNMSQWSMEGNILKLSTQLEELKPPPRKYFSET
ncbi:hypothetical protein O181_089353 [Austropuccinia psidii MF-1]|uniref:Uncharacterized protein n=1 Tax=Austropuccinia psidii MF-1 TaxID=1389203 RepID=A0A9Q3IT35_9BASI|nr:hypothetical protein [Austropuccinia psidii MF-1]